MPHPASPQSSGFTAVDFWVLTLPLITDYVKIISLQTYENVTIILVLQMRCVKNRPDHINVIVTLGSLEMEVSAKVSYYYE